MTDRVRLIARVLGVWGMALWVGGLPTYGGLVLPSLHDIFGVSSAALATRQVARNLNLVGLVVAPAWWVLLALDRGRGWRRLRGLRIALLAGSTLILATLFVLYGRLADQVDDGLAGSAGFYALHRVYLDLSTAQWLANLAILGLSIGLWSAGPAGGAAGTGPDQDRDRPR